MTCIELMRTYYARCEGRNARECAGAEWVMLSLSYRGLCRVGRLRDAADKFFLNIGIRCRVCACVGKRRSQFGGGVGLARRQGDSLLRVARSAHEP